MIPNVDAATGLLPPGIYPATLSEIHEVFVEAAPYREHRARIYRGLVYYLDEISSRFDSPRVLVNGGFVTHKPWGAPKDVDLAIGLENQDFRTALDPLNIALWTLQDLTLLRPGQTSAEYMKLERLQPLGGLVDSHIFPKRLAAMSAFWERLWADVKGEDGKKIDGVQKGYLEVIL